MKLLLDTHAFLWSLMGKGLSQDAEAAFLDGENTLYFSAVSYWEICLKVSRGKLILADEWPGVFDAELSKNSIHWLPIAKSHCLRMMALPDVHRDPFDRLLIAQALCEDMTLLTADSQIARYTVPVLW
ncbi:MAG: type II toxin-antitoxin system VapC family toxin [Anaerolineales bacterium]|nr:type II toxin-antitoxin system VapC family toxin [Anaerolineales bacterium]